MNHRALERPLRQLVMLPNEAACRGFLAAPAHVDVFGRRGRAGEVPGAPRPHAVLLNGEVVELHVDPAQLNVRFDVEANVFRAELCSRSGAADAQCAKSRSPRVVGLFLSS